MTTTDLTLGGWLYFAIGSAVFLFLLKRLDPQERLFRRLARVTAAFFVLTLSSLPTSGGAPWQRNVSIGFGLAALVFFAISQLREGSDATNNARVE